MKVRYKKEVANHLGPESCVVHREVGSEALTGETIGQPSNRVITSSGMPTLFCQAEGKTAHGDNRKSCDDPARSETLSMSGSLLHRNWEISSVSDGALSDRAGKGNRNPAVYADEKSDTSVIPKKSPNKGKPAEVVEGRDVAEGNADEPPACRTQSRESVSKGLEGVRDVARYDKRAKFTALLHHITPSLLVESFYALNRKAAVGVDNVTWRELKLNAAPHKGQSFRRCWQISTCTTPSTYGCTVGGDAKPMAMSSWFAARMTVSWGFSTRMKPRSFWWH